MPEYNNYVTALLNVIKQQIIDISLKILHSCYLLPKTICDLIYQLREKVGKNKTKQRIEILKHLL